MDGVAVVCNGMEAFIVCVLDEPVLRWLDIVGCMVAISAATGNPGGSYDIARYLLPEFQENAEAEFLRLKRPQPRAASALVAFDLSVMQPFSLVRSHHPPICNGCRAL